MLEGTQALAPLEETSWMLRGHSAFPINLTLQLVVSCFLSGIFRFSPFLRARGPYLSHSQEPMNQCPARSTGTSRPSRNVPSSRSWISRMRLSRVPWVVAPFPGLRREKNMFYVFCFFFFPRVVLGWWFGLGFEALVLLGKWEPPRKHRTAGLQTK